MLETMRDADGIGLAAPQVYQSLRLILFLDLETRDEAPGRAPIALINPELEPLDDALEVDLEGCLSIPGMRGMVPRHRRIGYRGLAPSGQTIEREAQGLHARVVQHEVDHLNGILFPMRMPDLRQLAFESELQAPRGRGRARGGRAMSTRPSRQEQRDRLLEAALVHVPFDGWSRRSLLAGAADLGMEPGPRAASVPARRRRSLVHLEDWADRQMLARTDLAGLARLRTHERIAELVRARLEILTPHREALRRATAARWLPGNAIAATTSLWRTVDLIWEAAGDRPADASYYSKRALLAAVWTSTFLFWLDDRSEALADTWAFLERRLDNVMRFGKLRARVAGTFQDLGRLNPLAARR